MAFKVLPDADLLPVIVDGDMSSNVLSNAFNLKNRKNAAIQLDWTGTPIGVFDVQVSINHTQDKDGNVQVLGTWDSLPLSANVSANGSGDTAYIELDGLSAPYIRVIYAAVSGSGVLNSNISAKST